MTFNIQTFKLNSGSQIPWLAWGNGSGDARKTALESGKIALEAGIRHIDTAQAYRNEENTGIVVKNSGIDKADIYVTSKCMIPSLMSNEALMVYPIVSGSSESLNDARASIDESIKKLGFIPDLFLIHQPQVVKPEDLKTLWTILEDLKAKGELKDIGVSNFRPQDLEAILAGARFPPVVNQIEYHPFVLTHLAPVLEICKKHDIIIESYGPLTPILRHPGGPLKPVLTRIAQRIAASNPELPVKVDEAVVLLLWTRATVAVAVSASGNAERIKILADISRLPDNLLSKEEVDEISNIGKTVHFRHYTEHMEVDFPTPDLPDGK
ncbi:Aldo/keto reductase [Cylindrobasidium torrendii FP15055 ss-10]|uniref:Aldo/keto reductase n=1 Tax=Cylindrobasidium torrendii FP15055 ss-10 TaxID=1314674 RepID=A0A0D7BS51_9AGAR|nr:Aldo/keto reductase [Cylindrobasidium torrendii FP15055 ss-10]